MIGIYDSGMGGLLLTSMLARRFPALPLLVYADTDGTSLQARSPSRVVEQAERGLRFLEKQQARAVIVACHEASTVVLDSLRSFTSAPLIDIASISATAAARASISGRIGILGTRTIIDREGYAPLLTAIAPDCTVIGYSCPLLLPLIEEGWYNRVEMKMVIKRCLRPLKERHIDTLLPACSLFQLVLPLITVRAGRRTRVIDPFGELATTLSTSIEMSGADLSSHNGLTPRIYITRATEQATTTIARLFGSRATYHVV